MAAAAGGGSTGALYSASEHQKRWVVFGLALNKVLVDQIRQYVGDEVNKEYERVKTCKGIESQSKSGRLMKWGFDLKYQNINGNDKLPKGHAFDYCVTSHVDFAKLFLESFIAKFNAFDEHCDASAVFNLLGRVPIFSAAVQKAASDVRQARNSWAHCALGDWDDAKFNQCFDDMEQLVKVLGLPSADEAHLVNDLKDWKNKGTLLLSSPDPALLQFVKQHVNTLEMDVDKMAFDMEQERQAVKKTLHDVSIRIDKLEEGFSSLEHRVTKLEGGQTSSLRLETADTDSPGQVQEEPEDSRDSSLSSLGISDFKSDIDYYAKFYDADTRHWLFADFDRWFSDPGDSRAYVLLGDAGAGKSVLAAELVKRKRDDGSFGACYFCLRKDTIRSDPRNLIGTVAYQLCKYNKEYRTKVGEERRVTTILANSALGLNELFSKLLQEPLAKCNTHSKRRVVIIDALDEINYESRKDFLDLLLDRFPLLPKWLVFFITSRPEDTVQFNLKRYKPCIKICAGNGQDADDYRQHEEDIRRFLVKEVKFSDLPYSVEDVIAKCNGMFLYAYYISQELSDRTFSIKGANLDDLFPGDIERYFLNNFDRICDKLGKDLYGKLFGCVIAAPPPLPLSFISFIIENEKSNLDVQTVIDAVSQFVVVRTSDNTFLFLHNLIPSCLTSEERARELFIDRGKASQYFKKIILNFLHCALSDQPEGGVSINRDVPHYLLHVGIRFLCCNHDNMDTMTTVFDCLTSFHFLQKRVNSSRLEIFSVVGDYKLCLQCRSLADAKKGILQEICTALRNNIYVLVENPHLLSSCLRWTSEGTQRALAVSGDTLMTCKSFDWFSYIGSTVSWENNYFVLSPDKKLLAAGNPLTGIVCMHDACSLKEVLGPVECHMKRGYLAFSPDGKFLLFGMEGVGLSVERGRVEEIPLSYREKRVTERRRHHDAYCFARAFVLWAKLELSQNKDSHSEKFCLRKVRCLLEVAEGCLKLEGRYLTSKAFDIVLRCVFVLERKKLKDWEELDQLLCDCEKEILECGHCCWYCEQEGCVTALVQRIAGMFQWDYFLGRRYCEQEGSLTALVRRIAGVFQRDYFRGRSTRSNNLNSDLLLCLIRLMTAFHELPSPVTVELRDCAVNNIIVQSSPNGKLIAVRDAPLPKRSHNWVRYIGGIFRDDRWNLADIDEAYDWRRTDTIQVFKNITETGETELFTGPVYVIEHVEAFAFTCDSDFVVYVQKESRCFQALSLQTGSILSCDSGFSPTFHIMQSEQVGFVFCAGSEKSIVPLSGFLVSSALRTYLLLPVVTSTGSPSGITFTLGGNISYLSSNLMLSVLIRNGDGSFAVNCTSLTNRHGCEVEKCAMSKQGNSIAVSQKASIFLFWDQKFPCTVFNESEDIGCQVSCLIFSHDSTLLLYCIERRNSKAEVCLWNVHQNKLSSCFFSSQLVSINCCCLSPDNSLVILCGELRVEIWEDVLCSRQCLRMVKELMGLYLSSERFHYCAVSSGNERLACCIVDDVLLCSLDSPAEESFWCLPHAHLGQIQFCQFLRENHYLISYGIDGAVFLWDLIQGKAVAYARVAEGEEIIKGMSVSSMEDEGVCLTSTGRVIMIKLHALKSAAMPSQMLSLDATESSLTFAAGRGYLTQEPSCSRKV